MSTVHKSCAVLQITFPGKIKANGKRTNSLENQLWPCSKISQKPKVFEQSCTDTNVSFAVNHWYFHDFVKSNSDILSDKEPPPETVTLNGDFLSRWRRHFGKSVNYFRSWENPLKT